MRTKISRLSVGVAVGICVAASAPIASAQMMGGETQLGQTTTPLVAPTCPTNVSSSNCTIILTRVTAIETVRDSIAYPTRVKKPGVITSFTVGVSQLSTSQSTQASYIQYLNGAYGGPARVGITVMHQGPWKRGQYRWTALTSSPMYLVQPYLGAVVQIPLATPIPVKAGQVIALSTPTWAPVLSIDVNSKQFAYRQSRVYNCSTPPSTDQALTTPFKVQNFGCNYPGTRLEYTATEVAYPLGKAPTF
jgi:hypothetical protein